MKKGLVFLLAVFFAYMPISYAGEKIEDKNIKEQAPQNIPQNMSQAVPGMPMPGFMAAGGMAQNVTPVLRESVDILKELIKTVESSNIAVENSGLIQKAKDIIKRGEDAVGNFAK